MIELNAQSVKWFTDIGLLIAFLVCAITGLFKFTLLMRALGLTNLIFPLALMSDIHDWSGIVLIVFVGVHLFMNRHWLVTATKKVIAGKTGDDKEC